MKQMRRRTLAMVLAILLCTSVVTPMAAVAEDEPVLPAVEMSEDTAEEADGENPTEEVGEETPNEEVTDETPGEEASEDTPAEEIIDETPAEEAVEEETPTEEVAEETAEEAVEEETPAEEVAEETTGEEVEEDTSAEEIVEEAPAEEVSEETPAEEVIGETPAEEIGEELPAENVVEEAPAEEVVEEIPADEVIEETPEEAVVEETPTEEVIEEAPAEETMEETPTEEIVEEAAAEETAEETPATPAATGDAGEEPRSVEIQVGDYIITVSGTFPEGTELQAVEIPRNAAAKMNGKAALFAYDIRLVSDGEVWQPEDYGTNVQMSMRNVNEDLSDVEVDILHVKTDLIGEENTLSTDALEKTLQDLADGNVDTEKINAETGSNSFDFDTSSFSTFVGNTDSKVVYVYNAELYDEASGKYAGVYTTKLTPNTATAEEAKTSETIGMPSIADANLPDVPTTESPAIIQGAAVGYEKKTGATTYELLDPNVPKPEPYNEFTVKTMDEQAADGTTHTKLSGFDGTYVIVRLDVSEFFAAGAGDNNNLYIHMEQKDNKALMPAATVAKPAADAATTVDPAEYTPTNAFTDGLGNRSASYKLSDLLDPNGTTPYIDVILYATAANVAGADAGKENVANGDVPLAFYVDSTLEYNSELVEYDPSNTENVDPNADPNDPNAKTSAAYDAKWHAKFFDVTKAAAVGTAVSRYVMKGSDLALETMVENSGGEQKNTGTTYWSMKKSLENAYYDLEKDQSPKDPGSGRTVKLMSEVAVTEQLTLQGTDANNLKKRTLDVNSFDIQIASNTNTDASTYTDGFTLSNAWLTIADKSNTTGAEMAIGNNAHFIIEQGGKLIIDSTCQLEIEWDGATTTPTDGQTQPAQQDVLNNGLLDLRAGGEIINNGILTIEGTEGKPYQEGSGTEQQVIDSEKGMGEMTIREGATLTNNGAMVVYGKVYNLGNLLNNGKYNDVIKSNDPDKGAFDYHKGIQVSWKDDVTQKNIEPGALINGKDKDGKIVSTATLTNNGDIVLMPGTLENNGRLINNRRANLYSSAVTEAIIPITPDPATPTVVTKRITLDPVRLSSIINNGTFINRGNIAPATVALNDNIGFGALTTPGAHPELFSFISSGVFIQITGKGDVTEPNLVAALYGSEFTAEDTWLYLYDDDTFRMIFADKSELNGTYRITDGVLVFTLEDGTVIEPETDEDGNYVYRIELANGAIHEIVIGKDFADSL